MIAYSDMAHHQPCYIGGFHVRYYVTEIVEGKPENKQRSHRCVRRIATGTVPQSPMAVSFLCEDFMRTINDRKHTRQHLALDLMVVDF